MVPSDWDEEMVPSDWDEEMINFQRNESSWCANNLIDELAKREPCICSITEAKFVGEATPEDEEGWEFDDDDTTENDN